MSRVPPEKQKKNRREKLRDGLECVEKSEHYPRLRYAAIASASAPKIAAHSAGSGTAAAL